MGEDQTVTAKTVYNYAIGRFRDQDKADLLILTLRVQEGDMRFVLDRRMSDRLSGDLAKIAKKLSAPRHEN